MRLSDAAPRPGSRPRPAAWVLGACALGLAACAAPGVWQKPQPTVVFITDFGTKDDSVALCKGVMWAIAPGLRVVDLTHDVPPYDIRAAGRLIAGTAPYYPAGTVFVSVVDPGVGSSRRAVAVRSKKGKLFVGPDNGSFTAVLDAEGLEEAREIANPQFMRTERSATFHGRDIFSPAAAYLADHAQFEDVGPVVKDLVRGPAPAPAKLEAGLLSGEVDFIEAPYGNAITNIPAALVGQAGFKLGDSLEAAVGETGAVKTLWLPFLNTFSDAPKGKTLALLSSRGMLSFSINMGDFASANGVAAGAPVKVRRSAMHDPNSP